MGSFIFKSPIAVSADSARSVQKNIAKIYKAVLCFT